MATGWKTIVVGLATVASSALIGSMMASPARAAVGCYGASCDGKSAVAQGCTADSRVLDTGYPTMYGDSGAYAQLGFSPACNAAWVRLVGDLRSSVTPPFSRRSSEGSTTPPKIAWLSRRPETLLSQDSMPVTELPSER